MNADAVNGDLLDKALSARELAQPKKGAGRGIQADTTEEATKHSTWLAIAPYVLEDK